MITVAELSDDPHPHLARLRARAPVAWVDEFDAWFVTTRAAAVEVMRSPDRFTVDDPRFSTGRVVGRSMLSTDGPEHTRHRAAFADAFRPAVTRDRMTTRVREIAGRHVAEALLHDIVDLRAAVAGPVAAEVAIEALGLVDTTPAEVLAWYAAIAAEVSALSVDLTRRADESLMAGLRSAVARTVAARDTALANIRAEAELDDAAFASNVAIVMFGALETSEAMIANLLRDVLVEPGIGTRLRTDPSRRDRVIEESLRLEPAATFVDRYVVDRSEVAGAVMAAGSHVMVSLAGANRDPAAHAAPDTFSLDRVAEPPHLAFATGPHACLGAPLARLEARAVLDAVVTSGVPIRPLPEGVPTPTGLVFRKPASVVVETTPS